MGERSNAAKFREAELMHARWAMLGVTGSLAVEILGLGNWLDAPLTALDGGVSTYMGNEVSSHSNDIVSNAKCSPCKKN